MSHIHRIAQNGFSTGTNDLYHRARPSYIPAAIAHIRDTVRSVPPLNVVEIGSGTGIFTQALLAHPGWSTAIKELVAVEPSQGMRDTFSKNITDDRVTVKEGTFDQTGIENEWADLVVVAQAFHWCPDYDRASAEFARILKPTGMVAFIWNLEDRDRARWVAQLRDRIESHEAGTPQFRLMQWRQAFETASYQNLFEKPIEKIWAVVFPTTVDLAVARACSKSYISVLEEGEKAKVVKEVTEIVERGEDRVWIDEGAGIFEYPYRTWLVLADKAA
ncbi:hypothetical protein AX15_005182 [Amanita polypyramis BW_CC]|nr:hypothetical protein AX15_005182 [Amanita polypyramis BW_CC]